MDEHLPSPPNPPPPLESLVEVLRAVVQKIQEPPYLFVIGISVLMVILVLSVIAIAPEISGPLYAALVVIGVLALAALAGGVITAIVGTQRERADATSTLTRTATRTPEYTPGSAPTPAAPTTPTAGQPIPPDCESLKNRLEMARKTLNALEVQEAGYTVLTMPAHMQTELQEQRRKVAELERTLAECLEREAGYTTRAIPSNLRTECEENRENVTAREEEIGLEKTNQVLESKPPIPFQNREDEIRDVLSSFASPCFVLDAPAGYGKSVLLKRLVEHFTEQGWLIAYASLEEKGTMYQLVTTLSQQLIPEYSLVGANIRRWGADLARDLVGYKLETITRSGLVFLIDFGKRPAHRILEGLLDQFLPVIQRTLGLLLPAFSRQRSRFRVVLAGRYLAGQAEAASRAISLDVCRLRAFDYPVVQDSVRALVDDLKDADQALRDWFDDASVAKLAAHLMHLTGGHPGCMARSMKIYKEVKYTPDVFLEICSEKIWKEIVRHAVQDVRDSVPRNLCPVLDRLSVFRYLDYPLLDRLTGGEEPVIGGYASGHDLAKQLTDTHLFSWQGRRLQDDITRRLFAIRLREEEENLPEWCRQAQEMYADHLQRPNTQLPEIWAIEYLYEVLQEHVGTAQDAEQRKTIRDHFFTNEIPKALHWLVDGRQRIMEQQALSYELNKDWEFRFTVNYFLRDEEYSDLPYQQLHEEIGRFFSA